VDQSFPPQSRPKFGADQVLVAGFTAREWQVWIMGMHELPGKICNPLVEKLREQLEPQGAIEEVPEFSGSDTVPPA
jgi:CYTH domain-containing protein